MINTVDRVTMAIGLVAVLVGVLIATSNNGMTYPQEAELIALCKGANSELVSYNKSTAICKSGASFTREVK